MKIILGIAMNPFEKIASLKKYWDLLKKKLQDYSHSSTWNGLNYPEYITQLNLVETGEVPILVARFSKY